MATGIGKRIREKRKEIGISQEELATRLGLKSKSTICKIERGEDNLQTTTIRQYAEALGTTPGYLMGREDNQDEQSIHDRLVNAYIDNDRLKQYSPEQISRALDFLDLLQGADSDAQALVENFLKSSQQKP